ncbi:unnamed protein product [Rotaria sordida]|uniref:Uncharacterized protein n=1 Tax=Rotaria sordida TaxID=392033 RepID=A0A814SHY0_9BILA|nr:unnamed protein product [Rotaria sordida]CAF1148635.1 unnamed protein product [Rotaria sordida]CAF1384757.1 unnamed protein product [Rotaria sordida]CAF1385058.1 unnamed protein product [Rotaria sordida]
MNEQQLDDYVNDFNQIRGAIKFIFEFDQNNKLNYLDTALTKLNINNETKQQDLKLDEKSSKQISLKNMTTRILETIRNTQDQKQDFITLKEILLKSNYPLTKIKN